MLAIAILTASALVFISAAIQHFKTVAARGLRFVMSDRSTPLTNEGFAGRATRTLQNNLESAAMFVPPALLLLVLGTDSQIVPLAAGVYSLARIGFTLAYWAGLNPLRSLFWTLGMAAIAITTVNAALILLT